MGRGGGRRRRRRWGRGGGGRRRRGGGGGRGSGGEGGEAEGGEGEGMPPQEKKSRNTRQESSTQLPVYMSRLWEQGCPVINARAATLNSSLFITLWQTSEQFIGSFFPLKSMDFILSLLVHVSHLEKSSLAVVIQIDEFLQSDHTCVITQVTEEECCQHPRGPCQDPPSYFLSPSSQWSPLSTLPTPPTSFVYLGA